MSIRAGSFSFREDIHHVKSSMTRSKAVLYCGIKLIICSLSEVAGQTCSYGRRLFSSTTSSYKCLFCIFDACVSRPGSDPQREGYEDERNDWVVQPTERDDIPDGEVRSALEARKPSHGGGVDESGGQESISTWV